MSDAAEQLPDDLASAHAMLIAERAARRAAEAEAASAKALVSHGEALIARLKLEIEKVRRELYGSRSERKARLLEQMELQLEELEAAAGEDELAAETAAKASTARAFERKRPARKPFPEHLPRERVVIAAPASCPCCGSAKLSKLGEDITETLEVVPRQWKVIQTVREKFTCRECEKITQPPAPFHVTPRGFAGPNLLAMILFEKFAQHQPLNRQSERYAREGIELSLSMLADQVGACATALTPIHSLIEAHVLAAERLHGDTTTVPILAKGKTDTGRIWTYVRDDRPFGGRSPPAALYHASRDRRQQHPERHLKTFTGILQADAYGGYNPLFKGDRDPGPLTQALCWAHARRKFFVLADIATNARRGPQAAPISPMALEAVKRIDTLFDIERDINGMLADQRLARRREVSLQLVAEFEEWMRAGRAKLSRSSPVTEAIDYMLKRWDGFTSFLDDGRICLTNNAAERALRGFGLGRKSWLFAGSRGRPRRFHGNADHDCKAQRHRSAGLAGRCPRAHRRYARHQAYRSASMALEVGPSTNGIGIMTSSERIARLHIKLDHIEPAIWRRIEVPHTTSLKGLHDVIQAVMLFEDYHLFEFDAGGRRYAVPDPEWDFGGETYAARNVRIGALVDRGISAFTYTYDFGDDWRHSITVETIADADPASEYPRLIDGERRAPPEDVGGLPGFETFLEAMAKPRHPQHGEGVEWYGGRFDPNDISVDLIQERIAKLARRRTLGKAGFARSQNKRH